VPELGLFPLPIVLVPTERIPLHIFEPRYRELVDECIELGEEFGFVLTTGDGAVHEIGTRARVAQVLDVLDDGSMNIIVEGGDRFRLLELTSGRAFTTGVVEPVEDDDDDPPSSADAERALEIFRELAEVSDSEVDVPGPYSPLLDFELAARVDFAVEAKQELLSMVSPRARMTALVGLLEMALEAIRLELTLRERASRNGKVAPLDPES
jgi:Lon protease-like protein